jgi:hypothetical protein
MHILPQIDTTVKKHINNRNELLALADGALELAQQYRMEWLATGNPQAWQLWRACLADRESLLKQVCHE